MSASENPAGAASGQPLVCGRTPPGLTPVQLRLVQRYRLTDHGDHVEWTDGRQVKRWRLADQPGADRSLPVLATVSRLHSGSAVVPVERLDTVRPIYCDPSGAFLAYASAPRMWIRGLSEQCYPPAVFVALTARGVQLVDERFTTVEQVERAHPGMSGNPLLSFYRRHAFLVIVAVFLVVIVVVEVITFARG